MRHPTSHESSRPSARRPAPTTLWAIVGAAALGLCAVGGFQGAPAIGGESAAGASAPLPTLICTPSLLKIFAGYNLDGTPLDEVSASWAVPSIATNSGGSTAGTWIAMRATGHGSTESFVQVGIVERVRTTANPLAHGYEAFWSSTQHQNTEQKLFSVSPGNTIVARLTRGVAGVTVTISDATTGSHAQVTAPTDPTLVFTSASWLQEDPSSGCNEGAYPNTSSVTFDDVAVNGEAPALTERDASIMFTPNNVILAPTPLVKDAFTVAPPTGIKDRYLKEALLTHPWAPPGEHSFERGWQSGQPQGGWPGPLSLTTSPRRGSSRAGRPLVPALGCAAP